MSLWSPQTHSPSESVRPASVHVHNHYKSEYVHVVVEWLTHEGDEEEVVGGSVVPLDKEGQQSHQRPHHHHQTQQRAGEGGGGTALYLRLCICSKAELQDSPALHHGLALWHCQAQYHHQDRQPQLGRQDTIHLTQEACETDKQSTLTLKDHSYYEVRCWLHS